MIIHSGNEITNPKVPGKILIGLECIRPVSIAEIRNHTGEIDQHLLVHYRSYSYE